MPNIIYEDNHIIVVIKPQNIASQGDDSGDTDLLTEIKQYLKEKYNKPGNVFVGLVHRLDRPTGGVMVFAKTSKAASRLSEQLKSGEFEKTYYAVLDGTLKNKFGRLTNYLKKDEKDNIVRLAPPLEQGSKLAELDYTVVAVKGEIAGKFSPVEGGQPQADGVTASSQADRVAASSQADGVAASGGRRGGVQVPPAQGKASVNLAGNKNNTYKFPPKIVGHPDRADGVVTNPTSSAKSNLESSSILSLVKVNLLTGRSHQIRVQFAAAGAGVFGDVKYGKNATDNAPKNVHLALWAYNLKFNHPITKERLSFVCLPPLNEKPWNNFDKKLFEVGVNN